jgi:hypothetical protein
VFSLAHQATGGRYASTLKPFQVALVKPVVYLKTQLQYLPVAIDLIERHFPSIDKLDLYLEHDPETEEEWLVLDLTLRGEVDEVLDNYDKYTDHWVSSVPWPQRQKIRLSYNII